MATSASFLNASHAETLKRTIWRYFLERRNIQELPDFEMDLRTTMVGVVQEVRQQKLAGDIETMNRRVLSILIPQLLQRIVGGGVSGVSGGSTNPVSGGMMMGNHGNEVNAVNAVNASPAMESYELMGSEFKKDPQEADEEKDKDVMFMERLQVLEQTRRLPLDKWVSPKVDTPVASTMDVMMPAARAAASPASMASHIATVFLPQPAARGQAVWIHSWQRNWIQYPQRNGFVWNGSIPQGADLTQSRVVSVFLPMVRMKTQQTPFVVLQLEGVGGVAPIQLFCGFKGMHGDANARWGVYEPLSRELSGMKTMACPWTVKLLTATGKMIKMGADGQSVVADENKLTLECEDTMGLLPGDECWLFGTQGSTHTWNAGICTVSYPNSSKKTYQGQWEDATKTIKEGQLLNFSQQWCVLLDIQRS
jgi:hypothetical protein